MTSIATSSVFTSEQTSQYLERIQLPVSKHAKDRLRLLTQLLRKHLAFIPFETLELHYSPSKTISLEPSIVFDKLITRKRGGYCLENNALFAILLRSLGFQVMSVVCRITMAIRGIFDGSWLPMSHMANVVTVGSQRYLVDVGYGADGPCTPLPLVSGTTQVGLPGQELMLEYRRLPQHQDPDQKVWMLLHRRGQGDWEDIYHFPNIEFLPGDYDALNDHVMAKSIWATTVLAQKFMLGGDGFTVTENLLLLRDEIRVGNCPAKEMTLVKKLEDEEARVVALEEHFAILLTAEEKQAIKGRPTELSKTLRKE